MVDAILIDGRPGDCVPADDRGLAYGDGVFRTLRVDAGQPRHWSIHIQRLAHDCDRLDLCMPNEATLVSEARRLFAPRAHGVLKIVISRGSGGRGYTPPTTGGRRILSAHALPAHADDNRPLVLDRSPVTLAEQPRLAGTKHLNRLEQVLARAECERAGAHDAYMCDGGDRIVSTTMRNLLFVDAAGAWLTPALTRAGIMGATRQRLLDLLDKAASPVAEMDIDVARVNLFSAALACNSVGGVVAVARIGNRIFPDSQKACDHVHMLMRRKTDPAACPPPG